jgi:hypothetical protein
MAAKLSFKYTDITGPDSQLTTGFFDSNTGTVGGVYFDSSTTSHAFSYSNGHFVDIVPGTFSFPTAINGRGEIVGAYSAPAGELGFTYLNGKFQTIDPAGSTVVSPVDVNDLGQVVGSYLTSTNTFQGFLAGPLQTTTIQVPGSSETDPVAINNRGRIAGDYVDAGGLSHAFVYTSGHYFTINAPGAYSTDARGISDTNDVFGTYVDAATNVQGGFLASPSKVSTFNVKGALSTTPFAINRSNEIAGRYQDASDVEQGFFYSKGKITTINIPGATTVDVHGINLFGVVGGNYSDQSGAQHGFLWFHGLSVTVDFPNSLNTVINGFNDLGQAVGGYISPTDQLVHGFIATPGGNTSGLSFIQPDDTDTSLSDTVPPATADLGKIIASGAQDSKAAHAESLLPLSPGVSSKGMIPDTPLGQAFVSLLSTGDLVGIPGILSHS